MKVNGFQYFQPTRIREACHLLSQYEAEGCVIAGGTSLLSKMKKGVLSPRYLIDLMDVEELKHFSFDQKEGLRIGAATLLREVTKSPVVRGHFPGLSLAAETIGSTQVRNMGTVGGNLCLDTMCFYYDQSKIWKGSRARCFKAGGTVCHVLGKNTRECYAAYRADLAIALICLKSTVRLSSAEGERVIPLEELFTHRGHSPFALKTAEILTEVTVPPPGSNQYGAFMKLSHRAGVDYGLITFALSMDMDKTGTVKDVRMVYGSLGPGPLRAVEAEDFLRGKNLKEKGVAEKVAERVHLVARPAKNVNWGSPGHRRRMMGLLAKRGIFQIVGEFQRRRGK